MTFLKAAKKNNQWLPTLNNIKQYNYYLLCNNIITQLFKIIIQIMSANYFIVVILEQYFM